MWVISIQRCLYLSNSDIEDQEMAIKHPDTHSQATYIHKHRYSSYEHSESQTLCTMITNCTFKIKWNDACRNLMLQLQCWYNWDLYLHNVSSVNKF